MRLAHVRPAVPDHIVPLPGSSFPLGVGRTVDVESPYWAALLADGSVVEADDHPSDPPSTATPALKEKA